MKGNPTHYDPERRLVHYRDGNAEGKAAESFFIERALVKFKRYGQPDWLLWAIDNGLPGLSESPAARAVIAEAVSGKTRKRGESPARNLKADELKENILSLVWFHQGRGLPVHYNADSTAQGETACSTAAAELGCSASYCHQVWKKAGGDNPQSKTQQIMRCMMMVDGKMNR